MLNSILLQDILTDLHCASHIHVYAASISFASLAYAFLVRHHDVPARPIDERVLRSPLRYQVPLPQRKSKCKQLQRVVHCHTLRFLPYLSPHCHQQTHLFCRTSMYLGGTPTFHKPFNFKALSLSFMATSHLSLLVLFIASPYFLGSGSLLVLTTS